MHLAHSFPNLSQIRDNAELAVRNLLKEVAKRHGKTELYAIDHLDDGTPIELTIKIDDKEGSAVFDFEGTGPEIFGNLNAPVSVTFSAIIYCLRAMVDQDVSPGFLALISIRSLGREGLAVLHQCSALSIGLSEGKGRCSCRARRLPLSDSTDPSQPRLSRTHHRQSPSR